MNITSGKTRAPRRVMIYGIEGIGKSTFAAMSPNPIFIQTEEGLGDIECDKFPLSLSYSDVMSNLAELYTEKHDYKTVAIDSLDWLERIIWAEVCRKKNTQNIEDIGYSKGYKFALTQWRETIEALSALRGDKGMNVILVAHSKIEKFENPETESYDRYMVKIHKEAAAIVQEWCDEVLFATYQIFTKQTDEGFNRKRAHGISGARVLRTTERPSHAAKNRLGMPEEIPLDWNEYAKYLPEGGK